MQVETRGNYLIQAQQAKKHFLTYDQEKIIRKLGLSFDEQYLYIKMLCKLYRLERTAADLQRQEGEQWVDANSYEEVMTLLDLVCDSREDRFLTGRWKSMESFGLQFHQNLLQEQKDPLACLVDVQPEQFLAACRKLGGLPIDMGDLGFRLEVFDGLEIAVLFWQGDEEFLPRIRYLWDENALQYLRYETMYFAVSLLRQRIWQEMGAK